MPRLCCPLNPGLLWIRQKYMDFWEVSQRICPFIHRHSAVLSWKYNMFLRNNGFINWREAFSFVDKFFNAIWIWQQNLLSQLSKHGSISLNPLGQFKAANTWWQAQQISDALWFRTHEKLCPIHACRLLQDHQPVLLDTLVSRSYFNPRLFSLKVFHIENDFKNNLSFKK